MLGSLSFVLLAAAVSTTPCESLRSLANPQTTIVAANIVAAGPFVQPGAGRGATLEGRGGAPGARGAAPEGRGATPGARGAAAGRGAAPGGQVAPSLPAHCRVTMVLKPSPDSNINVELWMPTDNWNGKLLIVGNGGFAGSI